MDEPSGDRRQRAQDRSSWPIRRFALGGEPDEDLSAETTPEERLGMMWELALRAWHLTGQPLPDYERHEAPGRVLRRGR